MAFISELLSFHQLFASARGIPAVWH